MSLLYAAFDAARHAGGRDAPVGAPGRPRGAVTSSAISVTKLVMLSLVHLPLSYAAPLFIRSDLTALKDKELPMPPDDPNLWAYLGTAIALVLLGGAFAGLTIALMGQDEIYLQVIATSGEGAERKNATKVLNLLKKGKHWVLVTLLLSNVITNETLPIVLDRSLGGGWPAVLGSTILIVIFGEIAPQSVCVRYGLPIGAWMAPFVLGLMFLTSPVSWPTAKLLDWLLGEDHGTVYKKAGLKTLVTLHKTLGTAPGERLNEDEVTIISAVLDLKDKPVGDIMTPMNDVFTMSADTILDEKMMDTILSQGYSRIPIYAPENPRNFIGMLLVKILITYDPEDSMRVRDFALATLPETAPNTSCLDIVNFFQEGKSHMVLCSDFPGEDRGALGVVTLEDVIEELIGEEIIDESDVFIDVHRAIRRVAPAPRMRYVKGHAVPEQGASEDGEEPGEDSRLLPKGEDMPARPSRKSSVNDARETTFMMRRRSSAGSTKASAKPVPVRSNTADLRQHLKHLGPSNVASKPRATKYTNVKIKPGVSTIPETGVPKADIDEESSQGNQPQDEGANGTTSAPEGGAGAGLLHDAAHDAKDGVQTLAQGYGTMNSSLLRVTSEQQVEQEVADEIVADTSSPPRTMTAAEASAFASKHASSTPVGPQASGTSENGHDEDADGEQEQRQPPEKMIVDKTGQSRSVTAESRSNSSHSQLGELGGSVGNSRRPSKVRRAARSGSITENLVDVGGMKKMVLETTSSSDDIEEGAANGDDSKDGQDADGDANDEHANGGSEKKKKKKKRGGKKFRNKGKNGSGDSTPLLEEDEDEEK